MGMDITFNIKGPKNGINAIRDVMPEKIWVNVPSANVTRIIILWLIPYCCP